jgi:hypothetical protein
VVVNEEEEATEQVLFLTRIVVLSPHTFPRDFEVCAIRQKVVCRAGQFCGRTFVLLAFALWRAVLPHFSESVSSSLEALFSLPVL